jgi:hypothetical protein
VLDPDPCHFAGYLLSAVVSYPENLCRFITILVFSIVDHKGQTNREESGKSYGVPLVHRDTKKFERKIQIGGQNRLCVGWNGVGSTP